MRNFDRLSLVAHFFLRHFFPSLTRPNTSLGEKKNTSRTRENTISENDQSRRLFRIHERSKVTRYRSFRAGYCASVGTLSSSLRSPRRCIFAPYVCPTCTRHLNTRAYSPAQSRPPPLLCVNCIIFTPNTFRPHAPRHGPPGSTGQIAHVHRKSPPVSQRVPLFYPNTPRSALSSTWVFPFFFTKVTYIRT